MSRFTKTLAATAVTGVALIGGAGMAAADAGVGSPGFLSGNVLQHPVHAPHNVCGNTSNTPGALNPTFGNACVND